MPTDTVRVADLRRDGGTQMRAELNEEALAEYEQRWASGEVAPPVVAFYDGSAYWLADGFHRAESASRAGVNVVLCDVRAGTRRDAILYAVGANANHGLRRTNADKRRAVETLLNDEEWRGWSDREIAKRAGVDGKTVAKLRAEVATSAELPQMPAARTVERNGVTYQQNTANIGRRPTPAEAPKAVDAPRAVEAAPPELAPASAGAEARPQHPERQRRTKALASSIAEALAAVSWLLESGGGDVGRLSKIRHSLRECQQTVRALQ